MQDLGECKGVDKVEIVFQNSTFQNLATIVCFTVKFFITEQICLLMDSVR